MYHFEFIFSEDRYQSKQAEDIGNGRETSFHRQGYDFYAFGFQKVKNSSVIMS